MNEKLQEELLEVLGQASARLRGISESIKHLTRLAEHLELMGDLEGMTILVEASEAINPKMDSHG